MSEKDLNQISSLMDILQPGRLVAVIFAIILIIFAGRILQRVTVILQDKYSSRRLLLLQVSTILSFILYIGGGTSMIYTVLNPPKEVLVALGGSAAVAIGISLKDIVASVVAGIILLFDRPFQVGDRVSFGDIYGEITGIGLRTVKLVTLDDNLVTIPNSKFLTDTVASGNAGELDMMVVFDFHLQLDVDLEKARAIIREVVTTSRFVYLKKPVSVLAGEVVYGERVALRLRAKAYVVDCRYEKVFQDDVIRRTLPYLQKAGLRAAGLQI